MPSVKHKAFAYITHGSRLLVFRHPNSLEAGIQVPAGTIENGERPEDAVMREAVEETGLSDLILVGKLGEHVRDMSDWGLHELHHRHFFHLRCEGDPPPTWQHYEMSPSTGEPPILFQLFWVQLPDGVPQLLCDHGKMLPELLKKMEIMP